jgi:hypothetical protein
VRSSRGELAAVLLVASVTLALSFTELMDGDLGFHLATGREVLSHGRIPATNVLSYTNPTHPWHLHQWLPGVVFELIARSAGLPGLQALKMLLVSTTWLVVYAGARALGARPTAAALGTLLGASAAAFRFELRPYLFTHLALAGTLTCAAVFLRGLQTGGFPTARRGLLGAALIPVLACHFHAGVIDSWLVLLALTFALAAQPAWARLMGSTLLAPDPLRGALWAAAALLGSVGLAALSLSLYHPVGARILLVPFDMGSDAYLAEHLVEFRTPTSFDWFALAPYWFLVGAALACMALGRRALHAFWPLATCGFLLLSLKHVRLVFGFAIVSSPVVALGLEQLLGTARRQVRALALVGIAAASLLHRYQIAAPGTALAARTFPPYLFDYLEKHRLDGPDYVSDAWAAPLLGRAYPRRKAFFDNRFEAYPRAFFLDVYQHIRYGKPGWDALLDRYGVQLVLMRFTTPGEARLQHYRPNLRQLLARDPRWALVTFDDLGALYVRRDGVNAQHARDFSLPHVEPDSMAFLQAPRLCVAPLRREIARGNRATRLLLLAAQAEREAGNDAAARSLVHSLRSPEAPALLRRMQQSAGR